MRQSREVKAETHQTVIKAASHLFRERGIESTSVGDVMKAADKTHGGFYRHFDSKESLLIAALEDAFADMLDMMQDGFVQTPRAEALPQFMSHYLSPRMVGDVGGGCPVAALSGDALRSTGSVRQVFGTGVRKMIESLAATLDGSPEDRLQKATQTFCMAAGALMIARGSDPETAGTVLKAVRPGA